MPPPPFGFVAIGTNNNILGSLGYFFIEVLLQIFLCCVVQQDTMVFNAETIIPRAETSVSRTETIIYRNRFSIISKYSKRFLAITFFNLLSRD